MSFTTPCSPLTAIVIVHIVYEVFYSVRTEYTVWCQKRLTLVSKETYTSVKRDLHSTKSFTA